MWCNSLRHRLLISPDPGTPPAWVGAVARLFARAAMGAASEATITPSAVTRRVRVAVVAEAIVGAWRAAPAAVVSTVIPHGFGALGIGALEGQRRGQWGRAG